MRFNKSSPQVSRASQLILCLITKSTFGLGWLVIFFTSTSYATS